MEQKGVTPLTFGKDLTNLENISIKVKKSLSDKVNLSMKAVANQDLG